MKRLRDEMGGVVDRNKPPLEMEALSIKVYNIKLFSLSLHRH